MPVCLPLMRAGGGSRTHTSSRIQVPKTCASAIPPLRQTIGITCIPAMFQRGDALPRPTFGIAKAWKRSQKRGCQEAPEDRDGETQPEVVPVGEDGQRRQPGFHAAPGAFEYSRSREGSDPGSMDGSSGLRFPIRMPAEPNGSFPNCTTPSLSADDEKRRASVQTQSEPRLERSRSA